MTLTSVRTLVPARTGRAVRVGRGSLVRVVDVEGQQVGDLFAYVLDPSGVTGEHLSASHTRTATSRLFPAIGEAFVTNRRRPILTLVEDTSPGRHDLLIAACDDARYAALGVPDHPSCARNLRTALGVDVDVVPQPVNVFMQVPVSADDTLDWLPATTAPGDSITFRAELDCVVVVSACPQDLTVINGNGPTDLAIDVLR
ncbi:urea carboxylase-associated family protein [Kribbella sp. HUAS MG21]|uniref:Urea carboxylase-associated family protein n=1 Tax=Kribbella sp. HUAS MG21 TaxID=3160966 RepID=A0AAU7T6I7_9ACTN